jgi:regulator of CtrA degradation
MGVSHIESRMHRHLIDSLYIEAMVLADEARSYFDEGGRAEREALDPMTRVGFSCESLKVTTRLMHVIAWLLTQRAIENGEMSAGEGLDPSRRLGPPPESDLMLIDRLPDQAREIIDTSIDLFRRTARLDDVMALAEIPPSPVQRMLERLAYSL